MINVLDFIDDAIDKGKKLSEIILPVKNMLKGVDENKAVSLMSTLGLSIDEIREKIEYMGYDMDKANAAIELLGVTGTKSTKSLGSVFDGLKASASKALNDLKNAFKIAGSSLATFLTSPVGIATAGLVATIGIGLYAIKQEYDKSFDGISESLEQFREDTKKTENEISDSQTKLAQNLERIAELKTQDATIDNTKEIANLERENALLAAQIAHREALLRIQEETEAKAARDARPPNISRKFP